jgi:phosphoglycolate phosphatase
VPARKGAQASGAQASGATPVSLVCCGLIGTMAADGGTVDRAFAEAIATQGVVTGTAAYARCMAQVHQHRGEPAAGVLAAMFPESQARGQAAHLALDRSFCDAIGRMGATPVPGAAAALDKLADAGIRVCVVTSFSRRVLSLVLDTLGWADRVDLALCPEDVPRGAPWPDLVLSAMLKLGVTDVREAAVAHDTESGLLSGRRAGAGVAVGVLTGPHSSDRLRRAGATHLIPSIAHLPELLLVAGSPLVADPAAPAAPASAAGSAGGPPADGPAVVPSQSRPEGAPRPQDLSRERSRPPGRHTTGSFGG